MNHYINPKIPEGINTSKTHPLKEFATLTIGILSSLIVIVLIVGYFAQYFARFIPFNAEISISESVVSTFLTDIEANEPIQQYLQSLADKITKLQQLPEEMSITLHYLDDDMVNAFATLGGHVFITRGILAEMPHENALVMVIAHEIAHIKHRHPITALGRGVVISLALYAVTGSSDNALFGNILSDTGFLTSLSFNRNQEYEADKEALQSIAAFYGHVAGASDLFQLLEQQTDSLSPPQFLSTHPNHDNRIKEIETMAKDNDWSTTGKLTPINNDIKAQLNEIN